MKRSKWCKHCNEDTTDCLWAFKDMPCEEGPEDRDDKVAKHWQSYRDFLAKEIRNRRHAYGNSGYDTHRALYKAHLWAFCLCAKQLRCR